MRHRTIESARPGSDISGRRSDSVAGRERRLVERAWAPALTEDTRRAAGDGTSRAPLIRSSGAAWTTKSRHPGQLPGKGAAAKGPAERRRATAAD